MAQPIRPPGGDVDEGDLREWLRAAAELEGVHRVALAWFRSRLPGYPVFRAPQLARNSPFTTHEYTPNFIWTPEERRVGLQFASAPPQLAKRLGEPPQSPDPLGCAAQEVHRELTLTRPWIAFAEAHRALDGDAKRELAEVKRDLAEQLAPDGVDRYESEKLLDRAQYRAHQVTEAVARLTGPARDYADAFGAVEDLLQFAICDIFGELALYGDPTGIDVFNLEFHASDEPIVEFEVNETTPFLNLRQVLWLNDPAVKDAVRIEEVTLHTSETDGGSHYQARILEGTAAAWPRDGADPIAPS
jgi:hypothetical protein